MEKKRRARINKCLDQLKSLLESYYSTSVSAHRLELKKLDSTYYIPILNRFPLTDSKAQTGKGRHPGAHCEPSKKPPEDTDL